MAKVFSEFRSSNSFLFEEVEFEVEAFPKNFVLLYFKDKDVQEQYDNYLRRRATRENYITPTVLVAAISLTALLKLTLVPMELPPALFSKLLWMSLGFGWLGAILGLIFLSLSWEYIKNLTSRFISDMHSARKYLIASTLFFFTLGNGLHLVSRSLYGGCDAGRQLLHCNEYEGQPPTFHYTVMLVSMLYAFIICKGLFSFLSNVALWLLSTAFLVVDTYIENGKPYISFGVFICCCLLLVVLHHLVYQEMLKFEYHVALQSSTKLQLTQSLDQAERDKAQLKMVLANVAHDLKTPLQAFSAGIHSLSDLVLLKNSATVTANSGVCAGILRDMEGSYAFMMMQINRALDVSKSENDVPLRAKPESVLLRTIVSWAINIMSSIQTRVRLKLKSNPPSLLDKLMLTDKVWLQENLLCLLSNAVKYSPADSTVTIRVSMINVSAGPETKENTEQLMVEVEDEGVGLSPEQSSKLFQPFAQAQRCAGGTGLGLYSLALRINTLGGSYGVRDSSGECGSLFYFSLPFHEDTTSGVSSVESSLKNDCSPVVLTTIPDEEFDSANPKVLVVDDSATTLKIFSRAIAQSGARVETAVDGFTALKLMKKNVYTVVIMDIQMPIMDGLESVRKLREWERDVAQERLPRDRQYIIGASACSLEETKKNALNVGMNEFLLKPVDIPALLQKLKSLYAELSIVDIV